MKEKMYFNDNEVIMNFDLTYPETKTDLLKSREFRRFLEQYMQYLCSEEQKALRLGQGRYVGEGSDRRSQPVCPCFNRIRL